MKRIIRTLTISIGVLIFMGYTTQAQNSIFGKWKTIDDKTGEAKSIVEIYEKDGKAYGKVTKIFNEEKQNAICDECDDDDPRKNQKILGMEIIKDMEKEDDEWTDGEILDPNSGSVYNSTIWLEDGKLHVRGYIGFSFIGRTQVWERVN